MSRARAQNSAFSVTLKRIDLDRGERAVLRDVNWRIQSGQRWLLVGGNGAGKTQLLKLLAGSVWPKPTGRELRRYRFRGDAFDIAGRRRRGNRLRWRGTPGPLRALRLEFPGARRGRHRRAAHRHSHARAQARRTTWRRDAAQASRHRRARRATLSHPVLRRTPPRAHRARIGEPPEIAAARRSRQWPRRAQPRTLPALAERHRALWQCPGFSPRIAVPTYPNR